MKRLNIYEALLLAFVLFVSCNDKPNRNLYPEELVGGFDLLPSEQTGIDFNNTIKESTYFNHYYYSQIYVGSGVAIGDINNDGLPDIFFGGNQVGDKLYLNKGNFQFDDISKKSKIAVNPGWTWGVTMVDINADGYLDIYVSRNGNSEKSKDRRNQLYINNQDLTFTESALKYGIADVGFSTQAAFFDMDNDGDLDMYQVNQPADKKALLINKIPRNQFKYFKDRLYRNDDGYFTDVSTEAGISEEMSYGLSVNTSDFNNDGFIDLYMSNDYGGPDIMYHNNGDGTFKDVTEDYIKHMSQYSMGSDTGDVNNDGLIDLITTDMTPADHYRSKMNMASMNTSNFNEMVESTNSYQYMTNTLQINTGLGVFSDVANLAGISSTDWSWASLLVDLDNDGLKDILVSNGIKKDIDNNDYRKLVSNIDINIPPKELFKYSQNTPSKAISNYAFKNKGNFEFEKVTTSWGFDTPSFSNGMAYGDLDNDGDLDIVTNNIESEAFVYENKATGNFLKIKLEGSEKNRFGIGAKAIIYYGNEKQVIENNVTRGFLSSVEGGMFFGLGKITKVDKVEVIWSNGKTNVFNNIDANQTITASFDNAKTNSKTNQSNKTLFKEVKAKDLGIDYKHSENDFDDFQEEILLPHKLSQNGPFFTIADINADGLDDVFIGGAKGQSGILYTQSKTGSYIKNISQPWEKDKASEDLGSLFIDVDNDGDKDLYVASGGNEFKSGNPLLQDRLYINDGFGGFSKSNKALPIIKESSQCVKASDVDGDGDLDLFLGTRLISGKYTFPATSYLLINNNGQFKKAPFNLASSLTNIGMVTDAVFTDIDKDNDEDLIVVGEWMTIKVLENSNGVFEDVSEKYGMDKNTRGIWWSITAKDLDNDGDDDYVIGNLGKNNKFKATPEHPFKVYANDFDENGTNDVVLAKFYKDDYVPLRGRECTSQQMPYVAEKFKDYHSFASSKLIDILPEDKVDDAVIYEISSFDSVILINDNGQLVIKSLPNEAQVSPIKSSIIMDVNQDGYQDILTVGNHYGVEVETTRYDAGFGSVLLGDGNNNFQFMSPIKSGFYVPYDSRNVIKIGDNILVTNNNNNVSLFSKNN
ncbi:VCBS repeat-containing protein [uncultured Winogradskyella sp.]|uniref:VCBS repeat-containing protein n=1 Tax=uncultured Winogradskyella sp. TaxID=395353 RepID=UPI002629E9FB|nr:VCBS repeat-containing protein [uncultured Winogradskyella sp.]